MFFHFYDESHLTGCKERDIFTVFKYLKLLPVFLMLLIHKSKQN